VAQWQRVSLLRRRLRVQVSPRVSIFFSAKCEVNPDNLWRFAGAPLWKRRGRYRMPPSSFRLVVWFPLRNSSGRFHWKSHDLAQLVRLANLNRPSLLNGRPILFLVMARLRQFSGWHRRWIRPQPIKKQLRRKSLPSAQRFRPRNARSLPAVLRMAPGIKTRIFLSFKFMLLSSHLLPVFSDFFHVRL
jgi:hypothetical protein